MNKGKFNHPVLAPLVIDKYKPIEIEATQNNLYIKPSSLKEFISPMTTRNENNNV